VDDFVDDFIQDSLVLPPTRFSQSIAPDAPGPDVPAKEKAGTNQATKSSELATI